MVSTKKEKITKKEIDIAKKDLSKNKSFKDFITYEMAVTKSVDKNQWSLLVEHEKIFNLLRDNPLTVKEIHNAFYIKEKSTHEFSINTLYRYLKKLQDFDLIVVAGHRTIEGERSPERLYSRSSSIYFPKDYENAYGDWVDKEKGKI